MDANLQAFAVLVHAWLRVHHMGLKRSGLPLGSGIALQQHVAVQNLSRQRLENLPAALSPCGCAARSHTRQPAPIIMDAPWSVHAWKFCAWLDLRYPA